MKTYALRAARLSGLVSLVVLGGCGGGSQVDTAPVAGTVTANGEPVAGGSLTFTPAADGDKILSGKPATAIVQEDGSYVLTTYEAGDGAVVGKHKVSYTPALGGGNGSHSQEPAGGHAGAPARPNLRISPDQRSVDVKPGEENVLDFELVGRR